MTPGVPRQRPEPVSFAGAGRPDAVTLLSLFVVLLFVLPARLVVPPLGGVGTPALLSGMLAASWWAAGRVNSGLGLLGGRQPVSAAVLAYCWFLVLGSAIAHLRPLTDLEASGSNRALLTLLGLSGVALLAADGIDARDRLDTLLRRLVAGAVFLAAVGIFQFVTGVDLASYIRVPGLALNAELNGVLSRSIFNRPAGTALHPIEFSVVLAVVLPVALHYALTDPAGPRRLRSCASAAVIAAAIPMSVSRSGIVGLVIGLLTLGAAWTWRRRLNAAVLAAMSTCALWALIPGLVGTIRNLFVKADTDISVQARANRIPRVLELVSDAPWLGRGFGTFSVEDYLLLDNQYYVTAIESGLVGVAVLLLFFLVAVGTARGARRRSTDPVTRHLGQALAASVLVVAVSAALFDAFFYRIFSGVMFLLIGCIGALWRLETEARPEDVAPASRGAVTTTGLRP